MYEQYLSRFQFDPDADRSKLSNCIVRIVEAPYQGVRLKIGERLRVGDAVIEFDYDVLEPADFNAEDPAFKEFVNGIFLALFERGLKRGPQSDNS
jgi:hypothetical protein